MNIGIDFASIDGNPSPDYTALARACAGVGTQLGFVIMRGAWGTWADPTVQQEWKRAGAAGLTRGAYLYLRMPSAAFTGSPEDQVHVFASAVGELTVRDFIPTIDVEATGLKGDEELKWVHRAWNEMISCYGAPPMIYTSDRVWREDLLNVPAGELATSPLWLTKPWPWKERAPAQLSNVPFMPGPDGKVAYDPVVPSSWGAWNWWIHQFQGDAVSVPGFKNTVDLNRFNMLAIGSGDQSRDRVSWVQRRLGVLDTGKLDIATHDQLIAFQRSHDLVPDGVIGPKTFAALSWCWDDRIKLPR